MVDTVVLVLDQTMFRIIDHAKFTPSTLGLYDPTKGFYDLGGRGNMKCVQNPNSKDLKNGKYKPRLSITKRLNSRTRVYEVNMKIEFSIPKLLFGNNFEESTKLDFYIIIAILQSSLEEMGVNVSIEDLIYAPVSSIHYSKNILLNDYKTPYTYMSEISKANINQRLDTNQSDFRNEGHSLKYRANSFEIAFYDKLKDLEKAKISTKRSEEKDILPDYNIAKALRKIKGLEVLRMEVRLNQRQKIKQILRKNGLQINTTFNYLFDSTIAKTILLYYIEEIEDNYPSLLFYRENDPKTFLQNIKIANPKIKTPTALKLLGFKTIIDQIGIRAFRELMIKENKSAWYSLNKELKSIKGIQKIEIFEDLKKEINKFEPIKLSIFGSLNDKQ